MLAAELKDAGAPSVFEVVVDVADEGSVSRILSHVERGSAPPLDVLVNKPGIASSEPAIFVSSEKFDRVLNTNLRGAWLI